MSELKVRLRADLTASMKARDDVTRDTVRMVLAAIGDEEFAGTEVRELTDDDVRKVLVREGKKRREAATAFDGAGREERAARERAEGEVIARYLPEQLSDDEIAALVHAAVSESGAASMAGMGQVMKLVQPRVAGRADGAKVAAAVRQALSG
ncbi:MAG: GatB/YqeY domain-containing protein [Mycobacteriales bacterium]|nr:MAG: glutamyl-tRNA amidotransferase [Pseudonocardiales bacterium]